MTEDNSRRHDTLAIHADRALNATGAVTAPIWQTATFSAETGEEFLEMATAARHDRFYTRYGNPTHSQAAAVIAALEGGETAMLSASGMGAMSSAVLAHVRAGDHVVAQSSLYAGTLGLLRNMLPGFGVETTFVDQRDTEAFARAIRPETRLIIVETPSNPVLRITDLAAVASLARPRGIVTIADNTFATPINQRPLELGIDIVMHSATKFLGGHSDLIAGALAGSSQAIERVWKTAVVLGACSSPFDAWLLLRGLRTLGVRVDRHNRTAGAIARYLASHANVECVHHPSLPEHPQHELAARQMSGFGGVLGFVVRGGFEAAQRFLSRVRLPRRAASLGGVESLAVHPAAMWAGTMSAGELEEAGVRQGLIRLSVGLENESDLIEDLAVALD